MISISVIQCNFDIFWCNLRLKIESNYSLKEPIGRMQIECFLQRWRTIGSFILYEIWYLQTRHSNQQQFESAYKKKQHERHHRHFLLITFNVNTSLLRISGHSLIQLVKYKYFYLLNVLTHFRFCLPTIPNHNLRSTWIKQNPTKNKFQQSHQRPAPHRRWLPRTEELDRRLCRRRRSRSRSTRTRTPIMTWTWSRLRWIHVSVGWDLDVLVDGLESSSESCICGREWCFTRCNFFFLILYILSQWCGMKMRD